MVQLTFPDINFTGTNSPGGWQGTNAHFFNEAANTFTAQDNLMWVKGRHSMVFGFQWQSLQDNENFALTATFNFNSIQTQGYNSSGTLLSTTGNAYASYLLGAVNSSGISQNSIGETGGRYKTYAAYIQDDFKVSSRLTLNLGLRWEVFGPFTEVNNLMSFFNPKLPNPAVGGYPGALQFAGNRTNGCNCSTPVDTHYRNFGPRLGAAYSLNDKTVLRAGYAIMYVHVGGVGGRNNSRQGLSQLGFNATNNSTSPGNNAPAYYWDNGVPPIAQAPPFLDPSYGTGYITSNPTGVQNPVYGDPKTRRQAAVLRELEFRYSALDQSEYDRGGRIHRQPGQVPARSGQRRRLADQRYTAAVSGAGFAAHGNGQHRQHRAARKPGSRASACRSRTSWEPSARCSGPSRNTAPSAPHGSTSASPTTRGFRLRFNRRFASGLTFTRGTHSVKNWTIC